MKKKAIVIGENAFAGLRNSIISAFTQIGWEIEPIDFDPIGSRYLASLAFRMPQFSTPYRLKLLRIIDSISDTKNIAFVLIIKGPFVNSKMINRLRKITSAPIVCWNPDSPFDHAISNHGAGIPSSIKDYDAYVTWADDVAEVLSRYNSKVKVIPFAWDPNIHSLAPGKGIAKDRIVFVGTGTKIRIDMLSKLSHLHPLIFGNHWPRIEGVEIHPPVYEAQMSSIVGEAKWSLNILNIQNQNSHNMRTFELPGIGGNQVTMYTKDHAKYLSNDPRTVLYSSLSDLEDILQSDPTTLKSRQPDLLIKHTYIDRVKMLIEFLGFKDSTDI